MIYGVTIDDKNTLIEWGLLLLADVSIGAAPLKTMYVEVPDADGALDLTTALTGVPVYGNREIVIPLFAGRQPGGYGGPADEWQFERVKADLASYCSGRVCKVWLPDDPNHYFRGRLQLGEKTGYNSGQVTLTLQAEPWRWKNDPTVYTLASPGTYRLSNEGRRVNPVINASAAAELVYEGDTYLLAAGDNVFEDLIFHAGENIVQLSGSADVTFTYQEAHL